MQAAKSARIKVSRGASQQMDRQDANLPPIQPAAANSIEKEKLDSWFEGVSQPSRRIQDLVLRKRRKHEALVRQYRLEVFRERSRAEQTVSYVTSNLRTELDKASLMIKLKGEQVGSLQVDGEAGPAGFREAMVAAWEVVRQLTEQRRRAVDAFYDLLLDVEEEHQRRLSDICSRQQQQLASNAHLPPPQLQLFMDHEMKEISEAHLLHIISFGDMRFCLNMQAQQDWQQFREGMDNWRRVNRERCQRDTINTIHEADTKTVDDLINSTMKGRQNLSTYEKCISEFKTALTWSKSYPFSFNDVKDWEERITPYLDHLETAAFQVIESLKDGLTQLKNFCHQQIQKLKKLLMDSDLYKEEKFHMMNENICKPILESIDKRITDDPPSLQLCWDEMRSTLKSEIGAFKSLLNGAGKLWDQHRQRQETEQQRTLQMLQKKMKARGNSVELKERRLQKLTERSRQETNINNLEKNILCMSKILDEIKFSYDSAHKNEKGVIQRHIGSIAKDIQLLSVSSKKFIDGFKQDEARNEITPIKKHSVKFMDLTEETITLIRSLEIRFYESIKKFLTEQSHNFVQQECEHWMLEQVSKLEKENSEIANAHMVRYSQIKSVQAVRLAEINEHENLIVSRQQIMAEILEKMQRDLEIKLNQELLACKDYNDKIKAFQEKGLKETSVSSVKGILIQVETSYTDFKNTMISFINDYQTMIVEEIEQTKANNVELLATTKLFSEGGCFATSEVTNITLKIQEIETKILEKARGNISFLKQKSKEYCTEAIENVKMCSNNLQGHLEYVTFCEQINLLIENTQEKIRKNVLELKYGSKLLQEQTSELVDEKFAEKSIYQPHHIWRSVIETVKRKYEMLLCGEGVEEQSDTGAPPYLKELVRFTEKNTFLPLIFQTLQESLRQIEYKLLEFHKKQNLDPDTPLALTKINTFMLHMASRFRLYQDQCIDVWVIELTDFLKVILKLKGKCSMFLKAVMKDCQATFHVRLQEEKNTLKINVERLRAHYQQNQIEVMAKLSPQFECPGDQSMLGTLCAKFEKASETLSQKIKLLLDSFMENAYLSLSQYEKDLKQQNDLLRPTVEYLYGKSLTKDLVQKIQNYFEHLSKFDSNPDQHSKGERELNFPAQNRMYPAEISEAIGSLSTTVEEFWGTLNQSDSTAKLWKTASWDTVLQNNLQEALLLVKHETSEVDHLYQQYKDMAEELRKKWRMTLESVQQFHKTCRTPHR